MKRGDKVLCINGVFRARGTDPFSLKERNLPIEGKTYTVRDVVVTDYGVGLRLEEIINPLFWHDHGGEREPAFGKERFVLLAPGDAMAETESIVTEKPSTLKPALIKKTQPKQT